MRLLAANEQSQGCSLPGTEQEVKARVRPLQHPEEG